MKTLRSLVGSGDKIVLLTLPVILAAVVIVIADPQLTNVGGPPDWLRSLSIVVLIAGLAIWLWSVVLILTNVPGGTLITGGPYVWVRHPLYTSVGLLVLPSLGFLLDTWLGLAIGLVLYLAARVFGREEEAELSRTFGAAWLDYSRSVRLGWL